MAALPLASAQAAPPLLGPLTATPSTFATSITSLATSPTSKTNADTSNSMTAFILTRPSAVGNAPGTAPAATSDSVTGFDQGADDNDDGNGLLNYYFLFLALFILLAFLGAYFLNRRRLRLKQSRQERGQDALRSDIQGSRNISNAMHWSRREESMRVEGLNEQGEAPPAYAKEVKESGLDGVAMPADAVTRDRERTDRKPPEYSVLSSGIPMVHRQASESGQATMAAEASRRGADG